MPGRLETWDRGQYDADTTRVRSTSMKSLVSPQGPRAYYLNHVLAHEPAPDANDGYSPKVTPLVLGQLFHELVIDGRVGWFATDQRRGTVGWKSACRRNAGRVALSFRDESMLLGWNDALQRNAEIRELLSHGRFGEQVITWEEQVTFTDEHGDQLTVEVPAKCAIDMLLFDGRFACLKTTRASGIGEDWEREVERHGYLFSAAFYHRGIRSIPDYAACDHAEPMMHVVLCKSPPYYAYLKPLSRQSMQIGAGQVDVAFKRYARCMHDMACGVPPLEAWPDLMERRQLDPLVPSMRAMERHGELAGEAI